MGQDYGGASYDVRGGHEEPHGPSLATILWEMLIHSPRFSGRGSPLWNDNVDGENLSGLPENLSPGAMKIWEEALDAIALSE